MRDCSYWTTSTSVVSPASHTYYHMIRWKVISKRSVSKNDVYPVTLICIFFFCNFLFQENTHSALCYDLFHKSKDWYTHLYTCNMNKPSQMYIIPKRDSRNHNVADDQYFTTINTLWKGNFDVIFLRMKIWQNIGKHIECISHILALFW